MGSTNLLDVVVGKGAAILELLAGEDQALLVWGNSLLVLDLALHIVDGVRGLDLEGDGLARQGLNEAVAKSALVPVPPSFVCASRSLWRRLCVWFRDSVGELVGACTYICTVHFVSNSFARLQ